MINPYTRLPNDEEVIEDGSKNAEIIYSQQWDISFHALREIFDPKMILLLQIYAQMKDEC